MNHILVLGGTGFVGRSVLERLVRRNGGGGGRITVPTRRRAHARHIQSLPTVEVVEADVHDPRALATLLQGQDAVIHLVAILHGSTADFERVHVTLPRSLAAACHVAGVRRLLHVSALGVSANAPSDYLRSKAAGEAALTGSPLDVTVLRPSVIFGARDRFLNVFAQLQALAPVVPLACADARFQPVWVEDVAEALARALDRPATIGQVIEAAGPRQATLGELVRLAGQWSGRARPVLPLPGPLAAVQARMMELMPGEPLMSRDNLRSMQVPNVASGTLPGLDSLGIAAAAMEAIMPAVLSGRAGRGALDALRQVARRD